jgi:hypothetical protein
LICPGCGKNNADNHRFCGNCGTRLGVHEEARPAAEIEDSRPEKSYRSPTLLGLDLPERSTHYPREGYDDQAETPSVSSLHEEFPPEVIEYDKQVPLIAEPGSDRRHNHHFSASRRDEFVDRDRPQRPVDIPPNEYAPTRPVESREPVRREVTPPEPVAPRTPSTYSPGYTGSSVLGLSVPTADEVGYTESAPTSREEERTPFPPVDDRPVETSRNHFLDFGEPARSQASLHGPSFLGLSSSPEYYDDEEGAVSHGRRNFALVVLALLAVLIALQWRSIKEFGQQYAQRGGIHIPGMKTKPADTGAASGNATEANANNSTAVNGNAAATSSTSNNGEGPNIEVAPTQNPNAAPQDKQPASNSASSQPSSTPPSTTPPDNAAAAKSDSTNSDSTKPDATASSGADQKAADKKKGTEVASNVTKPDTAADDIPQGEPVDDTADTDEEPPARPAAKARATTPRQPIDDPSRLGATELAQANAETDPQTQIGWLWRATAKGNWEAPVRLADIYIQGRGVPANCDQAMVILRSAAAKKNARARSKLGSLYASGQCVEQDRVAAYHWMSLALQANPGSEWIDHNRQSLWSQMNDDERRRAARDRNQ